MGWSAAMAPVIMGNPDRPELGEELTNSFCRTDPEIAKAFARVTFTSDNRRDLPKVTLPTLVLQCRTTSSHRRRSASIVHEQFRTAEIVRLEGDRPLSEPERAGEVIAAIRTFV